MNFGERENLSSTLRCTYLPNLCSHKGPAALALTNKDMSVRLPQPSRSSVISAGSKPSPENHVALMVRGQQQKGLVAFCNVGYLCTMGVLSLVTGGGGGGGSWWAGWRRYYLHAAAEEVEKTTFPNCSE